MTCLARAIPTAMSIVLFSCAYSAPVRAETEWQSTPLENSESTDSPESSPNQEVGDGETDEFGDDAVILEGDGDENDLLDLSLEELMDVEVVVTAGRHEQEITSVSYAVSVITAEEIRAAGARSVPDALRLVPGVDVAQLTYGVTAAVSPRGFHGAVGRSVLVLVDGRQIYDSHYGGTLWGMWPFLLEDIDRIEVIRGPGGVSWGANAVNGVINIITKDPADQQGVTLSVQGGNRGFHKEYGGVGFSDEKSRFRISLEFEGHEGHFVGGSFLSRPHEQYRAARGSLYGIIEPSEDDRITLSMGSAVVQDGQRSPISAGIGMGKKPSSQASYLMGQWTHQIAEDNHFDLTAYVNDHYLASSQKQSEYRYQQIALQFAHSFKSGTDHDIRWGIDSRFDILDGSYADPHMLLEPSYVTGIVGLYVTDTWRFAPRWSLDLGARLDYEFYGGFAPSARAALAYELSENSLIYGSISRAFQMPPVGVRFLDTPMLNGLIGVTGSPNLRPEELLAYEIGYRGRINDRFDLALNAFINDHDELSVLTPRIGPPGLIAIGLDNGASAIIYGFECEATYRVRDNLTLLANYTYQHLDWESSYALYQRDTLSPPRHKAMFGTRYSPHEDIHLSGYLHFTGSTIGPNSDIPILPQKIGSYFRLDLRAEFDFWDDNASLAVGVRNLLDNSHPEGTSSFFATGEVPRMVYMEMRVKIGAPNQNRRTADSSQRDER